MDRLKTTMHQGKRVILLDLSNAKPEEILPLLLKAHELVAKQPAKSALILTDVTNATYNKEVAEGIKQFVKNNSPYVSASAVVGADGVRLILLNTVIFLTRREIKTFSTVREAQNWLVTR